MVVTKKLKSIVIFNIICYNPLNQCRQYGDSSSVALFGNGKGVAMNTLEILTLLLVVFAALTYIDNHNNRK